MSDDTHDVGLAALFVNGVAHRLAVDGEAVVGLGLGRIPPLQGAIQRLGVDADEAIGHEKSHGRVTTRRARLFSLASLTLDSRWNDSGLSTLLVVEREAFDVHTKKTSHDTAHYAGNAVAEASAAGSLAGELAQAVRGHWGVESNNWIRDATFGEDGVKTKVGNQAQVMGLLRGLAIELIRKTMPKNFQAAIDKFVDSPDDLKSMLLQVKFL